MANPLRKTMVYLGLADEEFEYDNNQAAPSAPVTRTSSPGWTDAATRRAPTGPR